MSIEKPGQDEFEFPDEAEQVVEKEEVDELDIEVEDDTPAADRGRQPLPKELVDELEKDELEEYSDKVKNRLKQMKKVWHDERREKERAMREQNEAMAFAKRMLEENKKLKTTLFEGEKTYLDTYKASAELELGVAKKQYKDAYEAGDSDGIVEAQSKLAEVNYKIQKAREYTPSLQETDSSVYSEATPSRAVPEPDSKALAWKDKNTWFQRDEEMTALALGLEQRLVRQYGPQFVGTDKTGTPLTKQCTKIQSIWGRRKRRPGRQARFAHRNKTSHCSCSSDPQYILQADKTKCVADGIN